MENSNRTVDFVMSVVSFVVVIVGVPGNIMAILYFVTRGRDLPTRLYSLLSVIDAILCFFILPVGLSLANQRHSMLFGWDVFCTLWGVVWTWAPYMSVFLIAVLSITRTLVLLQPLRVINKNLVMIIVQAYGLLIAARTLAPIFIAGPKYIYLNKTPECSWDEAEVGVTYANISLVTVIFFLALPILPILVSCIISIYVIRSSIKKTREICSRTSAKRNATVTIIILTLTYIVLNFPLFLYLATFTLYYIPQNMDNWLGGSAIIDNYLWCNVYIMMLGVNSCANFAVYLFRIKQFRTYLRTWCKRSDGHMNMYLSNIGPEAMHIKTPSPLSPNYQPPPKTVLHPSSRSLTNESTVSWANNHNIKMNVSASEYFSRVEETDCQLLERRTNSII